MRTQYYFEDFTYSNYRRLIRIAKEKFDFIFSDQTEKSSEGILWRHDLDHSVERALKLATIEAEEGVNSTYYVLLHSDMYSVFEKETLTQLQEILSLGHRIGLHFDVLFYLTNNSFELTNYIEFEKNLLEKLLNSQIKDISFHFPQFDNPLIDLRQESFYGMINAYSQSIFNKFEYISDSNGYWRFKRLEDVLISTKTSLHVLTHPIWWTQIPMSPRDRIQLCINERAEKVAENYDQYTMKNGRRNIR